MKALRRTPPLFHYHLVELVYKSFYFLLFFRGDFTLCAGEVPVAEAERTAALSAAPTVNEPNTFVFWTDFSDDRAAAKEAPVAAVDAGGNCCNELKILAAAQHPSVGIAPKQRCDAPRHAAYGNLFLPYAGSGATLEADVTYFRRNPVAAVNHRIAVRGDGARPCELSARLGV